jgi:hypothetical protein
VFREFPDDITDPEASRKYADDRGITGRGVDGRGVDGRGVDGRDVYDRDVGGRDSSIALS